MLIFLTMKICADVQHKTTASERTVLHQRCQQTANRRRQRQRIRLLRRSNAVSAFSHLRQPAGALSNHRKNLQPEVRKHMFEIGQQAN